MDTATAAPTDATTPAAHAPAPTPGGRRLTLNFIILSGGEFLGKLATLAVFVYLGRVLGPERYGGIEFVLAAMIFFTLPVDFGLGVYGARELARDPGRATGLLREVSALRLFLACVSFALLLVLAAVLPRSAEEKWLLVVYGLALFGEPALLQWFFQGQDRMQWVAVAELIRKWGFALPVLLLVGPDTPLYVVGLCQCVAIATVAGFCLFVLRWRLHRPVPLPLVRPKVLWTHLCHSAPIGLSELAWAFLWYFVTVLLGLFVAGEQLGWFGAAHRVVMALHTFVWLYFYNLMPTFARSAAQPREQLRPLMTRSLGLTTWAGVLVGLVPTLLAAELMGLAYGPHFAGAAGPLVVLAWVIPVTLVSGHYRFLLIAYGQQRLECLSTAVGAVLAVGLGLLLIPLYGAVGAAVALLAANTVTFALAYVFACRVIAPFHFYASLVGPGLAAAAALACFWALAHLNPWVAAALGLLAYVIPAAAWAARAFALAWADRTARLDPAVSG